jgi:hypothetical protein
MVVVTVVPVIVVMNVARVLVDMHLNAVYVDRISASVPARGEDRDARDRCATRDDSGTDEWVHADRSAMGMPRDAVNIVRRRGEGS